MTTASPVVSDRITPQSPPTGIVDAVRGERNMDLARDGHSPFCSSKCHFCARRAVAVGRADRRGADAAYIDHLAHTTATGLDPERSRIAA
ncbi:hypothetical protein [Nocardia sp. NPDC047038]|uniref:hypothetical protein n=1 Tax=Nocardia sp. NPDC047038 TaxID=3154338 RepID=UPI0033E4968B